MIQLSPLLDDAPHTILIDALLLLPHERQGCSCKRGSREGSESFLPRKGVFFAGLCEGVQDPGLACGFAVRCRAQPVPAPCSWPAQAHGIPAASSSLLPGAAGPNPAPRHPALLLGEHRSPSVPCRAWLRPQKPNTFN